MAVFTYKFQFVLFTKYVHNNKKIRNVDHFSKGVDFRRLNPSEL